MIPSEVHELVVDTVDGVGGLGVQDVDVGRALEPRAYLPGDCRLRKNQTER